VLLARCAAWAIYDVIGYTVFADGPLELRLDGSTPVSAGD
jgi:hypothetical protein